MEQEERQPNQALQTTSLRAADSERFQFPIVRGEVSELHRWAENLKLDRLPRSRHLSDMRRKVRSFNVVIERDRDGFYVASVPELRGCHTQAKSLDVLLKRVREVVDLCLEVDSTTVDSPEFIGVQRISV